MSVDDGLPAQLAAIVTGVAGPDAAAVEARWRARGYAVTAADTHGDLDAALMRLRDAIDAARSGSGGRSAVAVIGYGAGGRAAFLAVTRLGADGAAAFRAAGIDAYLDDAQFARKPMSLHFADDDPAVPLPAVRAIKGALEGIGSIDIYRYEVWDPAAEAQAEMRAALLLDSIAAPSG